ncbi:hypothetical protein [Streptomyces sp. NPDC048340]|uniref:hypothetical protein n=1 Tax=Streptomyces sp. NPDC048340 TaxID=3365537 RepID=UPI00371BFEA8
MGAEAVTYREDVEYLEFCNPGLVEQNGEEFCRMHRLLASVDGSMTAASGNDWDSRAADAYGRFLEQAHDMITSLADAYKTAWQALVAYSDTLSVAKRRYEDGLYTEGRLSQTMARVASAITQQARAAEPLRQWEDLRKKTGLFDSIAEATIDVDSIRDEAESYYTQTRQAYGDAKRIEQDARAVCKSGLTQAQRSVPVYRGIIPDPATLLAGFPAARDEAVQAWMDPNVQLPGTGPKADVFLERPYDDKVSPKLAQIRARIEGLGLPPAMDNDHNQWTRSDSDQKRREWILANRGYLLDAAASTGIPPDVLAGIAWQEVEGAPKIVDRFVDDYRQTQDQIPAWAWPVVDAVADHYGLSGEPDATSMGPIAIQIRRSAEVLGYDPLNLTREQRIEIKNATLDPSTNIYIAAEYLAQLKAESEFALVPTEQMTPEQYQELAARYNGGPHWHSQQAQAYGGRFTRTLDEVRQTLNGP